MIRLEKNMVIDGHVLLRRAISIMDVVKLLKNNKIFFVNNMVYSFIIKELTLREVDAHLQAGHFWHVEPVKTESVNQPITDAMLKLESYCSFKLKSVIK